MTRWYVTRGGRVRGPFSEAEIFELIGKRQLERGDETQIEGIEGWLPIEATAPFMVSFSPIGAPTKIPSAFGWLLSTISLAVGIASVALLMSNRRSPEAAPTPSTQSGRCILRIPHKSGSLLVFPTSLKLREFKIAAANGLGHEELTAVAGGIGAFTVREGTLCLTIGEDQEEAHITLLDGPHQGEAVWIPASWREKD